ncbi:MAG: A/G-specific adenine glycosylase [Terracidiphilus sp.]|jgi:A/G-specific adenine glycosylase
MAKQGSKAEKIAQIRHRLLEWYDRCQRDLPWRRTRDPYAIWISEVMLQQTRVAAVVDRYQNFMARFPTLLSLAQAAEQDVLACWSGLGYYRRARMLHKAAKLVAAQHQGSLPATAAQLRLLPGIGAYTAAAVASIAHGEPVAVVDGNVERVLCRLQGWKAGGAAIRHKVEKLAAELVSPHRPGDFNQAMMELGATLCTPRNPQCPLCPLNAGCRTLGEHPTAPRPPMLTREIAHALVIRTGPAHCDVLLEQRPASLTVMPGLWELPALREAAVPEDELRLTVRHAIMQVNYSVRIRTVSEGDIDTLTVAGGARRWLPVKEAAGMALTGLTRKVLTRLSLLPAVPPYGES